MRVPILVGVGVGVMGLGLAAGADMQEQSFLDAAKATTPASRLDQMAITTLPTGGLNGLPLAPFNLRGCDEAQYYRQQFSLPERFDGLAWRESNCRNDVRTFCCYGYWQLYVSQHLRDGRLGPRYRLCEIDSADDLFGNDPLAKQKNACAAKAVYDVQGGGAWDAW